MLLFRQNISRLISKVEEEVIRKREIHDLYAHLSSLEDILNEIQFLMEKPEERRFTKVIDPLNTELIFISIIHSFERFSERAERYLSRDAERKPGFRSDYFPVWKT